MENDVGIAEVKPGPSRLHGWQLAIRVVAAAVVAILISKVISMSWDVSDLKQRVADLERQVEALEGDIAKR